VLSHRLAMSDYQKRICYFYDPDVGNFHFGIMPFVLFLLPHCCKTYSLRLWVKCGWADLRVVRYHWTEKYWCSTRLIEYFLEVSNEERFKSWNLLPWNHEDRKSYYQSGSRLIATIIICMDREPTMMMMMMMMIKNQLHSIYTHDIRYYIMLLRQTLTGCYSVLCIGQLNRELRTQVSDTSKSAS